MFASKVYFFALPLLLQAGLGAASPAPIVAAAAPKAGVEKRLFDFDLGKDLFEVVQSSLSSLTYGDSNGPCDKWADFVRCANADNVETAGMEVCQQVDDTDEWTWRVTKVDCGAKRAAGN